MTLVRFHKILKFPLFDGNTLSVCREGDHALFTVRDNGGGIPEKPCEKETKTYWLTLPGGFSLPLGIAITGIYEYDTKDEILQEASVQQSLLGQIQTRAQRDMIAGTILDSRCRIQTADGCIRLCATLRCEEMIARMQPANLKEAIE